MTDQTPPNQWAPPAGPPPGQPGVEMFGAAPGAASMTTESTASRGPRHLGRLGVAAALVVTAGVGGFAVNSALTEPAGPQSPGEAFEEFFVAVDNEDLAGVLELLPPGERESLVEPTAAVFQQLQRLDVLDQAADTSALAGFDLQVDGVSYSVEQLDPRLAWVTTTGGTVTASDLDVSQLPLGSVFRDMIDEAEEAAGTTLDEQVEAEEGDVSDLGQDPFSLAVIEDDGSWYISLMYTVAESARTEAGMPFPGLGNGPVPVGGATPGDAIKGMVEASISFDLERAIAYMDPVEMAALYDYSPLFLDDADAAADSFRDELGTVTLDRMDTRSWDRNGRTMVGVGGFAGRFEGTDPSTGEPMIASVDFDGDCYAVTVNGESEEICASDTAADNEELALSFDEVIDELGLDLSAFQDITFPEQGITVVERDGRWYVSVVPSMMYPMAEMLEQFEADAITDLVDSIQTLAQDAGDAVFGGSGSTVTPGFEDFEDYPFMGTTDNYVVEKLIPAGTSGSDLLAGGYVSVIQVEDDELDFATVWYLELEVGSMTANRDILPGEVLLVEDFG